MTSKRPHPLAPLSKDEFEIASLVLRSSIPDTVLFFRAIYLCEPPRSELTNFLVAEHAGSISEDTPHPARRARVEYDVIKEDRHIYMTSIVDIDRRTMIKTTSAGSGQTYFTPGEFEQFQAACVESELFKEAMSEFVLPKGFTVVIDPWPYGPVEDYVDRRRYMQGLVFAKNSSTNNADSNHYAYPIPIIPIMDCVTKKIIRIDRLPTGGKGDPLEPAPKSTNADEAKALFSTNVAAEYVSELLSEPLRADLKPLDIAQPEGVSFSVYPDNLVEWQKWRFRLSFTPREGAVLHDICYDNRPVLYRLSYSELTVPYGDPRPPFHRKMAFDLGDGGFGRAANSLRLGCDCVGAVHYFSTLEATSEGKPTIAESVVCLHEQDNGILWKHTNFRTDRGVVTRQRELIVQFIATLANYEYILAFKLDVAGGITIETRATGILSVISIDEGKTSEYGNVVAPGILAQNHQHIFAVRIDPSMDSHDWTENRIAVEKTVPRPMDPVTNPHGNMYGIEREIVNKACWIDADPAHNLSVRIENSAKTNNISGKNVAYKLVPAPTQLLLADKNSVAAKRAPFAQHHVWVTGYRDGELWAAGEFTNQSIAEDGGVASMVSRGDWFDDHGTTSAEEEGVAQRSSPVVWSVFGFTHNPRVEDWPVMPVEIQQFHLKPVDFFTKNPALDMPSKAIKASAAEAFCRDNSTTLTPTLTPRPQTTPKFPEIGLPKRLSSVTADHIQGSGPSLDAETMGAHVKSNMDGANVKGRSVSDVVGGILKLSGEESASGSASGKEQDSNEN